MQNNFTKISSSTSLLMKMRKLLILHMRIMEIKGTRGWIRETGSRCQPLLNWLDSVSWWRRRWRTFIIKSILWCMCMEERAVKRLTYIKLRILLLIRLLKRMNQLRLLRSHCMHREGLHLRFIRLNEVSWQRCSKVSLNDPLDILRGRLISELRKHSSPCQVINQSHPGIWKLRKKTVHWEERPKLWRSR